LFDVAGRVVEDEGDVVDEDGELDDLPEPEVTR
jgi:hypothetical protein